ncbi:MAG TPA: HD domain-containing phosphohydrolase [Trueperaceae bacterium]|nr:HD domain-containing phosphohydrolase [Trueperaceae bacterium]
MRILLVDDEEASLVLVRGILERAGYHDVIMCDQPHRAVEYYLQERPDLVVLDQHMPQRDGLQVLGDLRPLLPDAFPILMVTGDMRPELRDAALAGGAKDFLNKPVNPSETRLRIRNLLESRHYQLELQNQNGRLEEAVRQRTQELEHSQLEMLVRLARAAEYRDDDTGEHTWRVAQTSGAIARRLGLPSTRVEMIMRAARLHDVGKITVPDHVLLKPSGLTDEEFEVIRGHAKAGAELLSGSRSPTIRMAESIALTHHERWDGTGYPQGLAGDRIPLESRIVAVADSFDAITHDRVHRSAMSMPEAVEEIVGSSGSQFDPEAVKAFLIALEAGEIVAPSR